MALTTADTNVPVAPINIDTKLGIIPARKTQIPFLTSLKPLARHSVFRLIKEVPLSEISIVLEVIQAFNKSSVDIFS